MIPYTMKKIDLELENQLAHGQVEHLETTEISEIRKILKKKNTKKSYCIICHWKSEHVLIKPVWQRLKTKSQRTNVFHDFPDFHCGVCFFISLIVGRKFDKKMPNKTAQFIKEKI